MIIIRGLKENKSALKIFSSAPKVTNKSDAVLFDSDV